MSKSHNLCCKSLHSVPKFASRTQGIQVGNGQFVSVLFIIPIIIDIHRHRFEINTVVSEINENINLILGIKNIFGLEGIINSQDCHFNFLNRSLHFFSREHVSLKPKEQKLIKVEVPFIDEILGLAIVKIPDKTTHSMMMIKLKFLQNLAILDITNSCLHTIIFDPKEVPSHRFGILSLL